MTRIATALAVLVLWGCESRHHAAILEEVGPSLAPVQRTVGAPFVNSVGMVFVPIPAGEFLMGSPDDDPEACSAEKPQHLVRITQPFYLSIYEVTQAQYREVVRQDPSFFKGDDHPVDTVSWRDADRFCHVLSDLPAEKAAGRRYRLPTEAEWEYACRAGSTTRFFFGDDPDRITEYAWIFSNSESRTHPVGRKRPNAWGLYDMHGNVWEWCHDRFDERVYDRDAPVEDPRGPDTGDGRVVRGGGFTNPASHARCATRFGGYPNFRLFSNGFRVAATVQP